MKAGKRQTTEVASSKPAQKPTRRTGPRAHRPRPTPRWLTKQTEADQVAQRRCLLMLSVLSGETPVTDAIAAAGLSRATYYKLEERALRAMMWALSPASGPDGTEESALAQARAKVEELEAKVKGLEKERRRADRMAMLVRKLVKAGPYVMPGRGRPRGSGWTPNGPSSSSGSTNTPNPTSGSKASTPTPNSATES